jgi:hypothetical protein
VPEQLSPLVITACSNRKTIDAQKKGLARHLKRGSVDDVAKAWVKNLKGIKTIEAAEALYCGRGFCEARATQDRVKGRLVILSAGLGFVRASTEIPAYNMTVTPGSPDNVLTKLKGPSVSPSDWLARVRDHLPPGKSPSLSKIANGAPIIFCALSSAYVDMVMTEFRALSEKTQSRFRFFGLGTDTCLPENLRHLWMPYDDRLDGESSTVPGTRSDFSQRAMRHFVDEIYSKAKSRKAATHADKVREHLKGWRRAPTFNRQKCSDPELRGLIKKHWKTVDGRSTAMLRLFRDELQIACEQSRFQGLFKQVAEARGL